jgi:hypothetical protein
VTDVIFVPVNPRKVSVDPRIVLPLDTTVPVIVPVPVIPE